MKRVLVIPGNELILEDVAGLLEGENEPLGVGILPAKSYVLLLEV